MEVVLENFKREEIKIIKAKISKMFLEEMFCRKIKFYRFWVFTFLNVT